LTVVDGEGGALWPEDGKPVRPTLWDRWEHGERITAVEGGFEYIEASGLPGDGSIVVVDGEHECIEGDVD
jgi:hypothetical protein